jgi:ppGpp synthetase/RelA/SpoT-type nucleotidyltranferase
MTKTQVNKLGKKIRDKIKVGENPSVELLEDLQEYRTSFKKDISSVFNDISDIAKNVRKDSVISFRIKRIESILSKIERQPTMSLGNMGDIAGCRIITYSESSLNKVIKVLNVNYKCVSFNDYLVSSKDDGYRGYHLYIESPLKNNKIIEIQVRTVQGHKWASMVEIIDILYNLKIKEGQKHQDFQRFHLLQSNKAYLSLEEKKEMMKIDDKYNIHNKLNEVFIKNNLKIRRDWLNVSPNKNAYFIIEVDKNKTSTITAFESYEEAEIKYFEKFKIANNSNFVLTHIEKPNFKRLCMAYASYVLIKHDYINDWNKYTSEILDELILSQDYEIIKYFINYIDSNLKEQQRILQSEIDEFLKFRTENSVNIDELNEWLEEIKIRVNQVSKITFEQFQKKSKKNLWKKLFG